MKFFIASLYILVPFLSVAQEYSYRTIEFNLQDGRNQGSFTYKNLRLYPLKAKQSLKAQTKFISGYTPLKQALDSKKIKITEKETANESAEVNSLYIQNTSADTVYVMAGEVVQGGKQDRVIGQDMILPPNSGKKKLSVYCVEHGRWASASRNNEFKNYYSVSGLSVRKAIDVDKDQSKVWEKVAEGNAKNKVQSSTGAYTALRTSGDYQKQEREYFQALSPQVEAVKDIIGFIIVTGNKVIGCEIFATEQLFRNASGNLLKSYIHEAITNGKPVSISNTTVKKYMDDLLVNQADQEKKVNAKGKLFSSNGKKIHLTTYD
jgi:hypothetical protein